MEGRRGVLGKEKGRGRKMYENKSYLLLRRRISGSPPCKAEEKLAERRGDDKQPEVHLFLMRR